jgi:hypothetical protein
MPEISNFIQLEHAIDQEVSNMDQLKDDHVLKSDFRYFMLDLLYTYKNDHHLWQQVQQNVADIRFVGGKPWNDSTDDRWFCPIHMMVDGQFYAFVTDMTLPVEMCSDKVARGLLRMQADLIAQALTVAARDPEWRKLNLRYLGEDNAEPQPPNAEDELRWFLATRNVKAQGGANARGNQTLIELKSTAT